MAENRLPRTFLEWEPQGKRRKVRPKERWMDGVRRSMKSCELTEEDIRDKDIRRNLVLDEEKPL
jgi:hypothetical protein